MRAWATEEDVSSSTPIWPSASLPPTLSTRCVAPGGSRCACPGTPAVVAPSTARSVACQTAGRRAPPRRGGRRPPPPLRDRRGPAGQGGGFVKQGFSEKNDVAHGRGPKRAAAA